MRFLACIKDRKLAEKVAAAVTPFALLKQCLPSEIADQAPKQGMVIMDVAALASVSRPPDCELVMAVAPGSVTKRVECLTSYPWLSQLVATELFDDQRFGRAVLQSLSRVKRPAFNTLSLLGKRVRARRVMLYRSTDILKRLDKLEEFAAKAGGRPRAVYHLHDIANELLANAFWDAPYEAKILRRPPERNKPIDLPPDLPCELLYGSLDDDLFVRVRDSFGALTRPRLVEVLKRCSAAGAVALDESRGGAGLGMWRIFRHASRVVLAVAPQASTEMLVTVSKTGLEGRAGRGWHFLFDQGSAAK